jgi:hypothetical protein
MILLEMTQQPFTSIKMPGLPFGTPLHGNLGIVARPVKTKLLSVKFELEPVQMCWKFSDL